MMKRFPALLVLASALVTLASCGKGGNSQEAASVSQPYTAEVTADAGGDTSAPISLADAATLISATITDPAEDHRVISTDENSLTFGFWVDGLGALANLFPAGKDTSDMALDFQEDWNAIVSSWSVNMYSAIRDLVARSDVPDAHIIICLLDDRDQGSVLLGIYDGEVMTDIVNGIEK